MEIDTVSKYGINILVDFKPGDEPIRKDVAAEITRRNKHGSGLDWLARCLPATTPLATLLSEVTKIVQAPGLTLVMHELDNATRQIYTDGRPLPVDPNPSWLGYSIGRWDRDTLVVETIGFNGKAPLDIMGHPRSEAMRITERYRRRDVGHLDVEITFDDPVVYTKPFTIKVTHLLQADTDILEYFCNENEKDQIHLINANDNRRTSCARPWRRRIGAALVVGRFAVRVSGSTGPIPLNCNRACLEGVIDQYLAAVVAHDPKRLPLSADVKYTENNQVLEVGDGFWKTAQGVGNYNHVFADPEFGQVAFMGTMMEAGAPLLMSLRLRIELGRITEIESVYFKPGGGGPNNIAAMDKTRQGRRHLVQDHPAGAAAVAPGDDRRSPTPTSPGCRKMTARASGAPAPTRSPTTATASRTARRRPMCPVRPDQEPGTINLFSMDCLSQFKAGLYYVVQNIHSRRYPARRPGARRRLGALRLRSGHGELRRPRPTAPSTATPASTARAASSSPRRS